MNWRSFPRIAQKALCTVNRLQGIAQAGLKTEQLSPDAIRMVAVDQLVCRCSGAAIHMA
jgi:hypothetical protein